MFDLMLEALAMAQGRPFSTRLGPAAAGGRSLCSPCPEGWRAVIALEWVVDTEVGGAIGAPPRPPRYATKLRALQEKGPHGPLVLTLQDGEQFSLTGPHQFLLSPDGRTVAVCNYDGGLALLATSEITDLAPGK